MTSFDADDASARPRTPVRVVVDADACVPEELRERLGITTAPVAAAVLVERESIPRLSLDAGPLAPEAIAEACAAVAEPGEDVLYVRAGDGYASPDDAETAAREAVEARGARLHVLASGEALMAAGWAAVAAAEAARAGAGVEAAIEAGRRAAEAGQAIAMLEHPELAGLAVPGAGAAPGLPGATRGTNWRVLVRVEGASLPLLGAAPSREVALGLLRDRFAALARAGEEGAPAGALRVAILHASSAAGAEALATWTRRHLDAAEVVVAPLTRHAATRLGPGMLGVAWLRQPAA